MEESLVHTLIPDMETEREPHVATGLKSHDLHVLQKSIFPHNGSILSVLLEVEVMYFNEVSTN